MYNFIKKKKSHIMYCCPSHRQQVPQREDHEYDEIESVFEDNKSSIHDDSYAFVEPVTSRDDSQRNVYENGTFYRDSHPTPCDNTAVYNPASNEPVYDSIRIIN